MIGKASAPSLRQGVGRYRPWPSPRTRPDKGLRSLWAAMVLCLALSALAGACSRLGPPGQGGSGQSPHAARPRLLAAVRPAPALRLLRQHPGAQGCPAIAPGFSCAMRWRIGAAERYLATRPGRTGILLTDRVTGATWRNANAATAFPAASTVKLAMAADLLVRNTAGSIRLSPEDWRLIYNALHESSDTAADRLWSAFENGSFRARIRHFGMTSASFTSRPPYWGYMYCTPEDLGHLMNHLLSDFPDAGHDYLMRQLRHVAPIQQWGVWGAGPASRPGNKNGWEDDDGIWITNTVGFAGPDARYTLAIMSDLEGQAGFQAGADTLTEVSALLFRGRLGPTPRARPTP